ncbi:hypothetical protein JVX88_12045 [Leptolyngbya sp. 7M]|nr:hypothetical protein JVX88_12045 [Leptolyngbya sp. 7M]
MHRTLRSICSIGQRFIAADGMMQTRSRLKRNICRKTRPYEPDDLTAFREILGDYASGTDLCTLSLHRKRCY